jgi:hypothetical protein
MGVHVWGGLRAAADRLLDRPGVDGEAGLMYEASIGGQKFACQPIQTP